MITWHQFTEIALNHFRYLKTEFGFKKQSSEPPFIIFDANVFRILIFYDINGSHELDLSVRKIHDDPSRTVSTGIFVMAKLQGGPTDEDYQLSYPKTLESLNEQLERLSMTLRKYGSKFFV